MSCVFANKLFVGRGKKERQKETFPLIFSSSRKLEKQSNFFVTDQRTFGTSQHDKA